MHFSAARDNVEYIILDLGAAAEAAKLNGKRSEPSLARFPLSQSRNALEPSQAERLIK